MKNILYTCLLASMFLWTSCDKDASADSIDNQEVITKKSGWDYNYKLASTTAELSELMDDPNVNIVRTAEDFRRFVAAEPLLKRVFEDPLLYRSVVSTMKFNKRGIKTFKFRSLYAAYPRRYKAILTTIYGGFGFNDWLAADYEDYECSAPATCTTDTFSICIGANC